MRITIWKSPDKKQIFNCDKKESLYHMLQRHGEYIHGDCNGNGSCRKCTIRIRSGIIPVSEADKIAFTKEELDDGYRLSCKVFPTEDCEVELKERPNEKYEYQIISDFLSPSGDTLEKKRDIPVDLKVKDTEVITIDMGTTTIVMQLCKVNNYTIPTILKECSFLNSQYQYGSDIMARIQASVNGKKEHLTNLTKEELLLGINKLLISSEDNIQRISAIIITGNTTMLHILMGYSLKTLGVHPFSPVSLAAKELMCNQLFPVDWETPLYIMPGLSSFVGADIVSGILALEMHKSENIKILVDLGTNGEMVIGNRHKFLCTSTAAGPAFEGGNISYGIGSIKGAICSVKIEDKVPQVETIMQEKPVGICGTGLVEAISEFLDAKIIDETGLFQKMYFEDGYILAISENGKKIKITQKDIREFQMAKAAVAAGIKTLIKSYGVTVQDIEVCYLAGGFGRHMDIRKAIRTGLIPNELKNKIVSVGNSALYGAYVYGATCNQMRNLEEVKRECEYISKIAEGIDLAQDAYFCSQYIEEMNFRNC